MIVEGKLGQEWTRGSQEGKNSLRTLSFCFCGMASMSHWYFIHCTDVSTNTTGDIEVGQGEYPMAQSSCPQESGGDVHRNWSRTLCHSRATELQTQGHFLKMDIASGPAAYCTTGPLSSEQKADSLGMS